MLGLGQIADVVTRLGAPDLAIHPQQCSRLRHRNSTCVRCVESCLADAINLQETVDVDATKCTNCGACAAVCPSGALEATNPTNAELLHRIEQRKGTACIAFACPKAGCGSDERVVQVRCLGRLDESVLVGAASWQVEQILLVDGPCGDCPEVGGCKHVSRLAEESNALLQAFGTPPRISFVSELPVSRSSSGPSAPGEGLSRRAFFSMLTRETRVAAALTVSSVLETANETRPEIKKGALPQHLPANRELVLQALKRLGKAALPDLATQSEGWAICHISENCTGCQMCAFFCPTGALTREEKDGRPALAFHVARCTNCGLCRDICFWKSIELTTRIDLARVMSDACDVVSLAGEPCADKSSEAKLRRLVESLR